MAKADVSVIEGMVSIQVFEVEDRDTSSVAATIKSGEPVKATGTGNNFMQALADGDPESGTDRYVGITQDESDETATADGEVSVFVVQPFETLCRAKATTPANIDTAAKLQALKNDAVTYDLISGVYTVNESEGDDPNVHGLVIVGGDINQGTIEFFTKPLATLFGNNI